MKRLEAINLEDIEAVLIRCYDCGIGTRRLLHKLDRQCPSCGTGRRHGLPHSDITAIRVGCNDCGTEVMLKPRDPRLPEYCPGCGTEWPRRERRAQPLPNSRLIWTIQEVLQAERQPTTVRFAIDEIDLSSQLSMTAGCEATTQVE